jgi:nudix-type nucleoside diphosphatase (YffH/AdpP family)
VTIREDPRGNPGVRLRDLEVLSDSWYTLRRVTYDFQSRDGNWTTQRREVYDRGNGATILLRDATRDTVLLTRQFRLPAYLNGHPDGMLLEAPAGLLDDDDRDAETAIRREAEEETGYRVKDVTPLGEYFMSPGSVTERIAFFSGSYRAGERVSQGGGLASEGEDIEVVELALAEAIAMVERGEILDAKTVLLLRLAQVA